MSLAKTRVVTLGEAMLRFTVRPGFDIAFAERFDVHVAGAEANFAAAVAALGAEPVWLSRLPRNFLGRLVLSTLRRHGVDTSHVVAAEGGRVGVYYTNPLPMPGGFDVVYDRADTTFTKFRAEDFEETILDGADLVHATGITLAVGRNAQELLNRVVKAAEARRVPVSFDVNYRSALWQPSSAREAVSAILPHTDVLICSMADARLLFGAGVQEPAVLARELHEAHGLEAVALTLGAAGCIAYDGQDVVERNSIPTPVRDRIGRGDAFAAGFVLGWLRSGIREGADLGVAAGAAAQTTMGDLPRFTEQDLRRLLDGSAQQVFR
jgi:2-dehydro-3-deoxygluconokinase